jgi:DNA-binding NtrC family response regulator
LNLLSKFKAEETVMINILVVDDQKAQRKNLAFYLKSQGYDVDTSESGEEALQKLDSRHFDIVITDYKMDQMSGQELMMHAQKAHPSLEFIVITAFGTISLAVDLIKEGAADFLSKPFEYSTILDTIEKVLKRNQHHEIMDENEPNRMIAHCQKMKDILDLATKAASSDVTVLIEGEVGTGKELFARLVHKQSQRYREQFAAIECAASMSEQLDRELFGSKDGEDGLFSRANGGTILIRDIDRLDTRLQAKLLRYLREGSYSISDSATVKKSNIRIIVSTTRNLKTLVTNGLFREDLYYLLNVMPVYMPSLKLREGDILPLIKHFLAKYKEKSKKNITSIAPEVVTWMTCYEWPGNVQELENVIARACVLASGETLDESLIFTLPQDRPAANEDHEYLTITLKDNQRSLILKALKQNDGNFSRTATQLGISRTTLWRRLKRFKIEGLPVEQE